MRRETLAMAWRYGWLEALPMSFRRVAATVP
jgi:hypothetical protein